MREQVDEGRVRNVVLRELLQHREVFAGVQGASLAQATKVIWDAFCEGRKVLACGNGGSAADAQHFVAELVGRFRKERHGLFAVALTTDPSVVTAIANDYGFDNVFARQVDALGEPGDVLVAISTSGRSMNVLRACGVARQRQMHVIGLTGRNAIPTADICIGAPSEDTARIQEVHGWALHTICAGLEEGFR